MIVIKNVSDKTKLNKPTRAPVNIENFNALTELEQLVKIMEDNNLLIHGRLLFPEIKENLPEGNASLYMFLRDSSDLIVKYFVKEKNMKLASFYTRLHRFYIRVILVQVLFSKTNKSVIAVSQKYKELIGSLKTKIVILDYNKSKCTSSKIYLRKCFKINYKRINYC